MTSLLLYLGVAVAIFVGFNIGGSNTGVAFGPAVGSGTVSKLGAGVLMSFFFLLGGWTLGRRVVDTLGEDLVAGDPFTMRVAVAVLLFIGLALFAGNVLGVPASTSMTAVGAIVGLGLAIGRLKTAAVLEIVGWWLVAPIVGFWVSAMVGRYWYDDLDAYIDIDRSEGPLVTFDRSDGLPKPELGPGTTRREFGGTLLVVGIGCYMAFSAGTSNVANAVAPLVGNGAISMTQGVLLAAGATAIGALTIARRTLDTVGNDLTDLPLVAAVVVAVVSSSIVTVLSALSIPASFVVIATMSVVGLGWGRATVADPVPDHAEVPGASVGVPGESASMPGERVGPARETPDAELDPDAGTAADGDPSAAELYQPATTARVVLLQNLVPGIATVVAYVVFRYVPIL
ncbi:anion permease [Halorussus gelatinilyticus]|uniref:Phosphate transporter n=1 Tax=Halorussus gelatinilyticus TaxID=2937524 RepID=A0A8U0ILQ0_9EURY|nr:inorganic phosphate transporter [Halorussus gelatinilyticus]UPW01688.1 anion permease [Halorussus gelatinilyticus]